MTATSGKPIWYELLSADSEAAKAFYEQVVDWRVQPRPAGDVDYRMISTMGGEMVGGLMQTQPEMTAAGAKPGWIFYIGVEDVDVTALLAGEAGGTVLMPPFDLPGAGRLALLADPLGARVWVMGGADAQVRTGFDPQAVGKCSWNELVTEDPAAAEAFYSAVFGWTYPDRMAMPGGMGDYVFVQADGESIGAMMKPMGDSATGWRFYFRTSDIERAATSTVSAGGTVLMGPMPVPGGDRIIIATDAQGTLFGAAGPAAT